MFKLQVSPLMITIIYVLHLVKFKINKYFYDMFNSEPPFDTNNLFFKGTIYFVIIVDVYDN